MADEIDIANERAELFRQQSLKNRKPEGPKPTGNCLACGAILLMNGMRWCDADCRDDWQTQQSK